MWRLWYVFERTWAVVILLLAAALPVTLLENGPTVCMFRCITGQPCLGCGMTRAFVCVMHGDINAAVAHNRLVLAVFPLIGTYGLLQLARLGCEIRTRLKQRRARQAALACPSSRESDQANRGRLCPLR